MPKVLILDPVRVSGAPGSAGKRRQAHPLSSSSDSSGDEAPSSCSDYENITSPSSSTASGPTYVRTPGFQHHGHTYSISRPKIKKKRTILTETPTNVYQHHNDQGLGNHIVVSKDQVAKWTLQTSDRSYHQVPKLKAARNPVPMRLRALPQSFWQQPNKPQSLGSGPLFAPLPPLSTKDDGTDLRPVSPSADPDAPASSTVTTDRNGNVITRGGAKLPRGGPQGEPRAGERKITVGNTDLLLKLFEGVEKREKKTSIPPRGNNSIRRRPTKVVPISHATIASGEDPHMVSGVTEQLFPQLSLDQPATLHLVTLTADDRAVTLPQLSVDQNYSQMLSELVMHI